MTILYLDTSSSFLYTGIVKDDRLICEIKEDLGKDLSVFALKKITDMLNENKIQPIDIDKIIVADGPGSFTGIRVGITIAKTYAWALNKKITSISSLDAMALSCKEDGYKVPIIDARHDCSYFGIYDTNNNIVYANKYINNEIIKEEISKLENNYNIISNDTVLEDKNIIKYDPDILRIVEKYKDKEDINPHAVNPSYLKLTEAEEKRS